ncbi:hypothetical protein GGI09_005684, partial [Coemansia sp. S100]
DNSRLAALLSDAESLIEQLRKENASLVGHMNRALDSAGSYCGGGLESSMRSLSSSANSLHIGSVRHANVVDSLIVSRSMSTASSARSNQDTSALVYVSDVAAIHFAPTTPSSSSDQAASVIPRKSDIYNVTEFGQHHPARPKYSSDTFGEERPLSIGHSSTNTKHAAPSGVGSPIVNTLPQQSSGKRRKRHHDIASKIRSVQPVPRGEDGRYEMPVQVGVLTVLSLGTVIWDREAYHNERYIWPVGYTVQREYYSMTCPEKQVIYTCWVTDGGNGPLFHVEPEDMPGSPVVASTATGAWTAVLRTVNQLIQREHSNSASGPDYFGFSHPTIAKMIQDLPGAERCGAYIMQHFVDMKDRHVRGVIRKGRGGRPSLEMLSRGRRALMASTSANQKPAMISESGGCCESARRISVATLTNEDVAVTGSLE